MIKGSKAKMVSPLQKMLCVVVNIITFVLGIKPFIYLRDVVSSRINKSKGISKCECSLKQLEESSPWVSMCVK
jgi:hypothetical protein